MKAISRVSHIVWMVLIAAAALPSPPGLARSTTSPRSPLTCAYMPAGGDVGFLGDDVGADARALAGMDLESTLGGLRPCARPQPARTPQHVSTFRAIPRLRRSDLSGPRYASQLAESHTAEPAKSHTAGPAKSHTARMHFAPVRATLSSSKCTFARGRQAVPSCLQRKS